MVVFQKLIEALKRTSTPLPVFLEQNSPKLQENKQERKVKLNLTLKIVLCA